MPTIKLKEPRFLKNFLLVKHRRKISRRSRARNSRKKTRVMRGGSNGAPKSSNYRPRSSAVHSRPSRPASDSNGVPRQTQSQNKESFSDILTRIKYNPPLKLNSEHRKVSIEGHIFHVPNGMNDDIASNLLRAILTRHFNIPMHKDWVELNKLDALRDINTIFKISESPSSASSASSSA